MSYLSPTLLMCPSINLLRANVTQPSLASLTFSILADTGVYAMNKFRLTLTHSIWYARPFEGWEMYTNAFEGSEYKLTRKI